MSTKKAVVRRATTETNKVDEYPGADYLEVKDGHLHVLDREQNPSVVAIYAPEKWIYGKIDGSAE